MDLHIHSNISLDCIYSVEDILSKAEREKADVISITDHNSALAHVLLKHIDAERYFSGKVIAGAEIDTVCDGITFDILAYGFNVDKVQNWLYQKFSTVEERQAKLHEKLIDLATKKGFELDENFPWDAKREFAHINIFNNLKQYVGNEPLFGMEIKDGSEFYRNSTGNKDFVLYLDMSFLWADIDEVIKVIRDNGGITVLAHPFGYRKDMDVNKLLEIIKSHDVDGIEVYHPRHTQQQVDFLLEFAEKNNLVITGGSDWHAKEGEEILPFAKLNGLSEHIL